MSAPSRTCRSRLPPDDSLLGSHKIDENIFQRTLRGVEVLEGEAALAELLEQGGDAGALPLGVVGVNQLAPAIGQRQVIGRKRVRYNLDALVEMELQLLLAELVHEL